MPFFLTGLHWHCVYLSGPSKLPLEQRPLRPVSCQRKKSTIFRFRFDFWSVMFLSSNFVSRFCFTMVFHIYIALFDLLIVLASENFPIFFDSERFLVRHFLVFPILFIFFVFECFLIFFFQLSSGIVFSWALFYTMVQYGVVEHLPQAHASTAQHSSTPQPALRKAAERAHSSKASTHSCREQACRRVIHSSLCCVLKTNEQNRKSDRSPQIYKPSQAAMV